MTDMPLEALNGFDIVLSGYWEVPGGTTPEQVREHNETEADATLYEMAAQMSRAGAQTDIRLEFGPGGETEREYQNRLAAEIDADAILLADELSSLLNVMVPVRDSRNQDQIVEFLSAFDPESLFVVELYHAAPDETAAESAREMLSEIRQVLEDCNFTDADLKLTVEVTDDPKAAIADVASEHHLVVMGETDHPESAEQLFGPVCTYISETAETPVAVVQGTATGQ